MIGRNAPDSAALLGATEPHLNSDLVAITLAANKSIANFTVDTLDAADHPELVRPKRSPSYAQAYVPVFFTTLLHPDHPFSIAQIKLTYVKLTKMTKWIKPDGELLKVPNALL
jgi:hypothetical protein